MAHGTWDGVLGKILGHQIFQALYCPLVYPLIMRTFGTLGVELKELTHPDINV